MYPRAAPVTVRMSKGGSAAVFVKWKLEMTWVCQ